MIGNIAIYQQLLTGYLNPQVEDGAITEEDILAFEKDLFAKSNG
jgi:hypothetical protein